MFFSEWIFDEEVDDDVVYDGGVVWFCLCCFYLDVFCKVWVDDVVVVW